MIGEEAEDAHLTQVGTDVGRIVEASHHLLGLIDDVLDLSKVEAGRMVLVVEPFDLAGLLYEIEGAATILAARRHNRFVLEADAVPVTLTADRGKLRQILLNLLSNASKFCHDGEIRLIASADDLQLTLSVADTGLGMSEAQLSRLFQPFEQVHDADDRAHYGGTGLGLALSRRFAQLMGGDITVTSKPGAGSCFTVTLPRVVAPR